ncbi:MAG: pyridoxamine 5'-phosphate oxidase family protein [Akkermansia sp.]|nr:pyridoxamine 5'-phosphate oxidase family protein [Akkermansia sp.]
MLYTPQSLRRGERGLTEESARELMARGLYGILSLRTPDGGAYGVPLHFAWDGADKLYFHAATQGKKLDCIGQAPRVSFCIVGECSVQARYFSTSYRSVIIDGDASLVETTEMKKKALHLLLAKYTPGHMEAGLQYAERALDKTHIIQLHISNWCGKHGFKAP